MRSSQKDTGEIAANGKGLGFEQLIGAIQAVHEELTAQVNHAVNLSLTLRNWLIGFYIQEYEQNGSDRAVYGTKLLPSLSRKLATLGITRVEERELRRYRQFYQFYPQIGESVTPQLKNDLLALVPEIRESLTPISGKQLISKLSFTHIAELLRIDDATKRAFYEVECIHGNWSVRELKRQIGSLYYERSGLSYDKQAASALANLDTDKNKGCLNIRDPYVFEFLGLKPAEVMSESHLEDQILTRLQEFLLELGRGFCFEARQKRILIGDEHFFVDLVFYHRLLKCHVLVELKVEPFSHSNIGQLNTYVSWYQKNEMTEGDNPPIGILLCTDKNHALVEYALAGMDNRIFVSKYQLELPSKDAIQAFVNQQLQEVENDQPI